MVRGLDLIQSDFGDNRISQSVNFISKFVRFGGFVHPVLFPLPFSKNPIFLALVLSSLGLVLMIIGVLNNFL